MSYGKSAKGGNPLKELSSHLAWKQQVIAEKQQAISSVKRSLNTGLVSQIKVTPDMDSMLQEAIRENHSKFPAQLLAPKNNVSGLSDPY